MADTAVATVSLAKAGDYTIDTGVGTAIVHANTHVITPSGPLENGFLVVQNTFNGAKAVTIKAGDNPPAFSAGQGDLSVSVADGDASYAAEIIGGLESARFLQDNGTLRVDVAANMTGFMYWVQLPVV
jgi:hypothetical protein